MIMKIEMKATDDQVRRYEFMCNMNEGLLAQTLAKRIEGLKAEESVTFIQSWFESVRNMAIAAHLTSGIKISITPEIPDNRPG